VKADMAVTAVARSMNQEKLWTADMSVTAVARFVNQEKL